MWSLERTTASRTRRRRARNSRPELATTFTARCLRLARQISNYGSSAISATRSSTPSTSCGACRFELFVGAITKDHARKSPRVLEAADRLLGGAAHAQAHCTGLFHDGGADRSELPVRARLAGAL